MPAIKPSGLLDLGDQQLEYKFVGPQPSEKPTLVLLHEGLGCVGLWGDFPEKLAAKTGCGVFVYSRAGYGQSSTIALPRPLTYMHIEAQQVLPRTLAAIGFRAGFLVGHSDGASIAAIYAGSAVDDRLKGITLIAPHFFTEEKGLIEIARAKVAYETGNLRERLARWHKNVDAAFLGWNNAWLDPEFRKWNLEEFLPRVGCPVLAMQGVDDQYGTDAQVKVVAEKCPAHVEIEMLPGAQHSPHREAPDVTVAKIAKFVARLSEQDQALAGGA